MQTIQVVTPVLEAQAAQAATMAIPLRTAGVAETTEIVLLKAAAQAMLVLEETEQEVTEATAVTEATVVTVLVHHS